VGACELGAVAGRRTIIWGERSLAVRIPLRAITLVLCKHQTHAPTDKVFASREQRKRERGLWRWNLLSCCLPKVICKTKQTQQQTLTNTKLAGFVETRGLWCSLKFDFFEYQIFHTEVVAMVKHNFLVVKINSLQCFIQVLDLKGYITN
jgi:hypothetical protein